VISICCRQALQIPLRTADAAVLPPTTAAATRLRRLQVLPLRTAAATTSAAGGADNAEVVPPLLWACLADEDSLNIAA